MTKLLHIIATPRGDDSSTLQISRLLLNLLRDEHPAWAFDELNLTEEEIPSLTTKRVDGKYTLLSGKQLFGEERESWDTITHEIHRFLSADFYVISTPMWNFSIPYFLKQYIDVITQPKYLFQYTKTGVEGLAKNKKMVVVTSSGGDYASEKTKSLDFLEPYLQLIFGFIGIKDITFIKAEPMDMGEQKKEEALKRAEEKVKAIIYSFHSKMTQ